MLSVFRFFLWRESELQSIFFFRALGWWSTQHFFVLLSHYAYQTTFALEFQEYCGASH